MPRLAPALPLSPGIPAGSRGTLASQLGRKDLAAILSTGVRLLAIRPRDVLVLLAMARAHSGLGRVDDACHFYLGALEVEPDDFNALQEAGHSFFDTGENERAYPLIRRALENAPTLPVPIDRREVRVTRVIGWLEGPKDAVAAARRRHDRHQRYLRKWLDWAAGYVEWCESVLEPRREIVN